MNTMRRKFWGLAKKIINFVLAKTTIVSDAVSLVPFVLQCYFSRRQVIIIGLTRRMGDIVACEPVARHVRKKHPNAYIVWCCGAEYRELSDSNPCIDRTVVVDCLYVWSCLKRALMNCKIIDLHLSGSFCRHCGYRLIKRDAEITTENYYYFGGLLEAFTKGEKVTVPIKKPNIYIGRDIQQQVDELKLPKQFIVIHGLSSDAQRAWDRHKWLALAKNLLIKYQYGIVEIGLEPVLAQVQSHNYLNLCRQTSILETAEVIRRSVFYIGVDSGPAHLASAVGTRGIILLGRFGKFDRYDPFGGVATNLSPLRSSGSVSSISVATINGLVEKEITSFA
ncbi:MAG: glycosyltransferase family 9 protein [Patescibacteria group bacterium]